MPQSLKYVYEQILRELYIYCVTLDDILEFTFSTMAALPRPSQVLLFSYPRTACHLLERMLSMQPKMSYLWHPFAPARPSQTQMFSQEFGEVALLDEARVNYLAKIQEGVEAWQKALSMAEAAVSCAKTISPLEMQGAVVNSQRLM